MRKRIAPTVLMMIVLSAEVFACRYNAPASERIRRIPTNIIVLGEVENAAYEGERSHDWHPWRGVVAVKRVLVGQVEAQRFQIGRSGSTAACDDGIQPPKSGDFWIVYLADDNGVIRVAHSYPLSIALASDPRLRDLLALDHAR